MSPRNLLSRYLSLFMKKTVTNQKYESDRLNEQMESMKRDFDLEKKALEEKLNLTNISFERLLKVEDQKCQTIEQKCQAVLKAQDEKFLDILKAKDEKFQVILKAKDEHLKAILKVEDQKCQAIFKAQEEKFQVILKAETQKLNQTFEKFLFEKEVFSVRATVEYIATERITDVKGSIQQKINHAFKSERIQNIYDKICNQLIITRNVKDYQNLYHSLSTHVHAPNYPINCRLSEQTLSPGEWAVVLTLFGGFLPEKSRHYRVYDRNDMPVQLDFE